MQLYKGFSTYNRQKKFRLTDFDIAKQDLFNALHIRKGEKLMNPNYGTIIWAIIFEPYSDSVKEVVVNDIKRVIAGDPRLFLEEINLNPVEQGIMVNITVRFKQTNELSTMQVMFDQNTAAKL
jgi:phage baseplate assembly protein W